MKYSYTETRRILAVLILSASFNGCMSGSYWIREELYFGSGIPTSGIVTDSLWQQFVDSVITPRFPEGITVLESTGQYRLKNGRIEKERTRILVVYYQHRTKERDALVREIASAYVTRFSQEAVMRVTNYVRMKFYEAEIRSGQMTKETSR